MKNGDRQILTEWLVLRYKSGDRRVISTLAKLWYPRILRHIYLQTRDIEISKDIAQETWISVMAGLQGLKNPSSFGAWTFRIAIRKSSDWLRKAIRERKGREGLMGSIVYEKEENEEEHDTEKLKAIIQSLPEKQKAVILLFYFENYDLREISEILLVSIGTVKSRLFHARERLKNLSKNEDHEKGKD